MAQMLQNNRIILETAGFVPGVSSFPEDEDIRDALSNLLENTALIGDIILRLPEISQSLLSSHNNWVILLSWSLQFANQTDLLDQQTVTLIDLVSQEMNFTARSDNYINPYKYSYRSEKEQEENEIKPLKPKKKNKTKDSRRGPRLSSRGNGEL
ncbi:coiled-coil domain-containing protein 134-like isoform X2 [Lycorma delicatula]|uniref:coiled-coil domain-containing protein 134-like isoform X2 n=1 Tax=Lycorma delicatula TaxID=130591 RepID=UPI003F517B1C